MGWIGLVVLIVLVVLPIARRRRRVVTVSRSDAISTLHLDMARNRTAKQNAALDDATRALR